MKLTSGQDVHNKKKLKDRIDQRIFPYSLEIVQDCTIIIT